jgi:hypothetical protein
MLSWAQQAFSRSSPYVPSSYTIDLAPSVLVKANNDQNLPFQKVQHRVATLDAQPSSEQGGIMVLVTGGLLVSWQGLSECERCVSSSCRLICQQVDDETKPMSYSQVFQLSPDGQGSYYVFNDIFRLVYPS